MPARWMCLVVAVVALHSLALCDEAKPLVTKEYDLRELAELLPDYLEGIVAGLTRDVLPDSWQTASGRATAKLVTSKAKLIVLQTPDAHDELSDWIELRIRLAEPEALRRRAAATLEKLRRPPTSTADLERTHVCRHLDTPLATGRNLVFGIVTQLAWQDLKRQIGSPVELAGNPGLARMLNAADPTAARLDPACYVAIAGRGPEAIERLHRELAKKFPDKAGAVVLPPDEHTVLLYAYLFRRLPFAHWFERQKEPLSFRTSSGIEQVASFGIADFSFGSSLHDLLRKQVTILDYVSDDDFVIQLHADGYDDEIVLAKVGRKDTLGQTIDAVRSRIDERSAKTKLKQLIEHESLVIPVIDFNLIDSSSEIRNTEILNRGWEGTRIGAQTTRIQFRLDETGAVIEMEEELEALTPEPPPPRHFVFDRPFLIYLAMPGASSPYFAVWIENSEVLELAPKDNR